MEENTPLNDKDKKKGNPYAFPQSNDNNEMHDDYNGMMLRDYIAIEAMKVYLKEYIDIETKEGYSRTYKERPEEKAAKMAYYMARVMMKARNDSSPE